MKIENSYPGIDGISTLTNGLSYLGNEFACVRGLSSVQLLWSAEHIGTVATSTTGPPGRIGQVALSATIALSSCENLEPSHIGALRATHRRTRLQRLSVPSNWAPVSSRPTCI